MSGSPLSATGVRSPLGEIAEGVLTSVEGRCYPVTRHVPRFVDQQHYTRSFGFQWNRFRLTQLDSHSGVPISRDRFYRFSGWSEEDLNGRLVLDVGCGAGRFTEVALDAGAHVVALDFSAAVDSCWSNHGHNPRLTVLQADIVCPPFAPGTFDYIYCFGVLQHTPDPAATFAAIARLLSPGGRLAVDVYPRLLRNLFWPKYWLRPVTKRMSSERLFRWVERTVPAMLRMSRQLGRVPVLGSQLKYAVPVANYEGVYPLTRAQLVEWAVLDTFDMLSPEHDQPQSGETLRQWFEQARLTDVEIERPGFLVGRGRRPPVDERAREVGAEVAQQQTR